MSPAFQGAGGGLVCTADDYDAYFRMLLDHGMDGSERILSRAAVELMTTNRLSPGRRAAPDAQFGTHTHRESGPGPPPAAGGGGAWR
ncbi:serine hydrolase, partial [Streptomyces sp. NPDC059802]